MATKKQIILEAQNRTNPAFRAAERNVSSLTGAASSLRGAFASLAGATGAVLLIRSLAKTADAATNLENQLKLVTDGANELKTTQSKLADVARDTRGSFGGTVDLYSKLARTTSHLGVTQADLLTITTSVNKAISMSGTTAIGAESTIRQLGQGRQRLGNYPKHQTGD